MYKLLVFLCIVSFCAANENLEDYEILAKNLNSKDNILHANGDVVVFSKQNYMTADKAIYDKEKKILELFGNVFIMNENNVQIVGEYTIMELGKKNGTVEPSLMYNTTNHLWVNSSKSNKKNDDITLESSIISSCDCENPDWSLRTTSGDYNTQKQWINAYNVRLFIKSTPVFYTPYFGFPTNKDRRSGLLLPTLGLGGDEGFIYSQPIYFAPADNYDFEFRPQVRTTRGEGMYAYYRYADAPDSILELKTGYFKNKKTYFDDNALENIEDYGYDIYYDRQNILTTKKEESQDALFASIHWLNDIDYKNLAEDRYDDTEIYNKNVESKVNYFYNSPTDYYGTYFRYYIDTTTTDNSQTMQQLPKFQYHTYEKSFFTNNLRYTTDMKLTNNYRESGLSGNIYDLNIPLIYSTSFFDELLNFKFTESISATAIDYLNDETDYKDAYIMQNKHSFYLGSDLIKPYETFVHSITPYTQFDIPNNFEQSGDLYKINNYDDELEYFPVSQDDKVLMFGFNQSFFGSETLTEYVRHKIYQSVAFDEYDNSQLSDLSNEITFFVSPFTIDNRVIYNQIDNEQTYSSSTLNLSMGNFNVYTSHYMTKETPNSDYRNSESYVFGTNYRMLKDYTWFYDEKYNIEDHIRSERTLGVAIDDTCWNLNIKYKNGRVATSSTLYDVNEQDVIYFTLVLKSLTSLKHSQTLSDYKE